MSKRTVSAPFMHVGRGGAGNYTQSNEIQSAKSPRSAIFDVCAYGATGDGGEGWSGECGGCD